MNHNLFTSKTQSDCGDSDYLAASAVRRLSQMSCAINQTPLLSQVGVLVCWARLGCVPLWTFALCNYQTPLSGRVGMLVFAALKKQLKSINGCKRRSCLWILGFALGICLGPSPSLNPVSKLPIWKTGARFSMLMPSPAWFKSGGAKWESGIF